MDILRIKMVTQPEKIIADFNLYCITLEGVNAIKAALIEGQKVSTPQIQIKYRVLGSPMYECYLVTTNKKEGIKLMGESLSVVEKTIKAKGGNFSLITSPKVLGEHEKDIKTQLAEDKENIDEEENDEEEDGIQFDTDAPKDIINS